MSSTYSSSSLLLLFLLSIPSSHSYLPVWSKRTWGQRWKLCRKLGRSFPVGLGTSSRILRGSPAVFVLSRNFAVNCAFFGLFWVNFADFQHFWVDFGHFWANFEHFLTAFISRFFVNGSDSQ